MTFQPIETFDPTKAAKLHDQLNDYVFTWKPEDAHKWHEYAHTGFGEGIIEWDGIDGWQSSESDIKKNV